MISPESPYTRGVNEDREHGPQPLDALMNSWGLGNHDLVDASTEQLTHKQVQRARTGRVLTLHMMQKVTRALNIAVWYRLKKDERETYFEYLHKHLRGYFLPVIFGCVRKDRDAWATSSRAIGDMIRAARKRLGITQKQLARLVRVTGGTLLTWEKGRHEPSEAAMRRLEAVLGAGFAGNVAQPAR